MIIKEKTVKENKIDIQLLQVKSPYGACKATKSRLFPEEYAIRIGSIAKVNGLIEAIHPNHLGIKDIGAKAVLAKRTGRLAIKIIAINSICPGNTNANPRLKPVIANTNNNKVITMMRTPPRLGQP